MKKTSVYLTEEAVEDLRRASELTGRSQAELIREGVRRVVQDVGVRERTFHSLGIAEGSGEAYRPWDSDGLYRKVMGRE